MRIVIPSIQVPFITGGANLMTEGLAAALRRAGHEAEIVSVPFKFFPESYIAHVMDFWCEQDFSNFSGVPVDKVVALQFPAYYVKHESKIVWLMHQHRAVYELYDDHRASGDLKSLREKIHRADSAHLSGVKKIFSMSETISRRLRTYNSVDAVHLYHPPYGEDNFYCEESYGYIFCPSRLEILKRQDLLIRAMKFSRTPVRAIIAGDGGQESQLRKLIEELDLTGKVRLIGRITEAEKYTLYARALAIFFGPLDEDYGYVTLESMLSSKAVVTCTDSGGPLEFVRDNVNGLIVEPDPEKISRKIDWLYMNRHKAREMGVNGYQTYRALNISWEKVVCCLLESD